MEGNEAIGSVMVTKYIRAWNWYLVGVFCLFTGILSFIVLYPDSGIVFFPGFIIAAFLTFLKALKMQKEVYE